jgi:putative flippase GtrA
MQQDLATTHANEGLVGAASALAHRLHLPTTLIKFLMVGGVAFVIFQVFLYLLYGEPPAPFFPDLSGIFWFLPKQDTKADLLLFTHPDIRLLIASVIAVEITIVFQFNSHERWTFRNRRRAGWTLVRFLRFNLSSIVSPIIIVLTTNILSVAFNILPYISSIVGVLIGFGWNWTLNSLVIWPKHEREPLSLAVEDSDFRTA